MHENNVSEARTALRSSNVSPWEGTATSRRSKGTHWCAPAAVHHKTPARGAQGTERLAHASNSRPSQEKQLRVQKRMERVQRHSQGSDGRAGRPWEKGGRDPVLASNTANHLAAEGLVVQGMFVK